MHAPDSSDPWASLAESLGVGPGSEPPRQPPAPAARPASPPPVERAKPRPAAPAGANWDDLAAELGVRGPAGEQPPASINQRPPRRVDRAPIEQPRPRREDRDEPRRTEGRTSGDATDVRSARVEAHDVGGGPAAEERAIRRDDADSRREDEGGERRGRRRRGRRGGRGRRDREEAGTERIERRDPGTPTPRRDDTGADGRAERHWDEEASPGDVDRVDGDREGDGAAAASRDEAGDRPRRRRRRGRRGGRSRPRGDREGAEAQASGRERGDAERADDLDDEPLPASYGTRVPARSPEPRDERGDQRRDGERPRAGDDESAGGSRRRRRRRRGGEGRSASGRTGSDAGRGRRSRGGGGDRGGSSRSSRVRRADFAPVVGAFDEDDEGLEFLGVEEAGREPGRREPRTEEDVLAESGLDGVRDVPSWVEAIGIVIAGNLDARSRGRGEGGRRDR